MVKWGVILMVPNGAWLDSGLKKDVHHTGGQLGRKSGGQVDLHFDNLDIRRNIVMWGVIFMVPKGAWLDSGLKKDVNHTRGHLGRKSGGQGDLHFDNLDIRRNIVKWGVILMVPNGAWLDSGLKKDVHHTGGQLGRKSGGQGDLNFDNLDIRRNIVKSGVILMVPKGAWLKFELKYNVHNAGDHLVIKRGGQSDLHLYNYDVMRKWGVIFMVQKGVWLKSELSFNVHSTKGHLVIKRGGQSDLLHFGCQP